VSYIVIQPGEADQPVHREFADIESAIEHIEMTCNGSGGTEVRLCRIEPVEFKLKQYFKVEIPTESSVSEPAPSTIDSVDDSPEDDSATEENTSVFEPLTMVETSDFEPLATRHNTHLTGESRRGLFGR